MIQRVQTLYLLLAGILGAYLAFFDPNLWRATLEGSHYFFFTGQSNFLFFVLSMVIILLALVCIFLFKNRKLQLKLTILNLVLGVGLLGLQYFLTNNLKSELIAKDELINSTYLPGAFLPILLVVVLFLAARGIRRDEKLVKSLDRMR